MYESNFLDLDPVARDRSDLGLPVIRITFQQYRNELAVIEYVRKKSVDLLKKMGVEKIWMGPTLTGVGSSHDLGGLRIGDDATNSVVDADLMTHEVPNLDVMSGAVFPSCPESIPDADDTSPFVASRRLARTRVETRRRIVAVSSRARAAAGLTRFWKDSDLLCS
jgi:hypothetical protein